MFAVDMCNLPATGGSTFVVVAGLFLLIAGVVVTRWVRQSAGRLSVVVAPLVLLGGLVSAPQVADPCAPATTLVATTTTLVATTTTLVETTTTTIVTASTTTTVALTCATGGSCAVGDTGPGGGIMFYVDLTREPGAQYLEAACAGWSDGICGGDDLTDPSGMWGCYGTPIPGADGTAIGTGEQNTTDITAVVGGCPTSGIPAGLANDLTLGGQTDWFLPSKDELNVLCKWAFNDTVNPICNNNGSGTLSLTSVGGFSSDIYWSSSEYGTFAAWLQFFYSGGQNYSYGKGSTGFVRPVRAF